MTDVLETRIYRKVSVIESRHARFDDFYSRPHTVRFGAGTFLNVAPNDILCGRHCEFGDCVLSIFLKCENELKADELQQSSKQSAVEKTHLWMLSHAKFIDGLFKIRTIVRVSKFVKEWNAVGLGNNELYNHWTRL